MAALPDCSAHATQEGSATLGALKARGAPGARIRRSGDDCCHQVRDACHQRGESRRSCEASASVHRASPPRGLALGALSVHACATTCGDDLEVALLDEIVGTVQGGVAVHAKQLAAGPLQAALATELLLYLGGHSRIVRLASLLRWLRALRGHRGCASGHEHQDAQQDSQHAATIAVRMPPGGWQVQRAGRGMWVLKLSGLCLIAARAPRWGADTRARGALVFSAGFSRPGSGGQGNVIHRAVLATIVKKVHGLRYGTSCPSGIGCALGCANG